MERTLVQTTEGKTIKVKPLSREIMTKIDGQVLAEFTSRNEPLQPPTYELETLGGGHETKVHDSESVKQENNPEVTAIWEKHQDAVTRLKDETQKRQSEYALLFGIELEMPKDDMWIEMQKMIGVSVPPKEDMKAYRLHYITTELLKTPADTTNAISRIFALTFDGLDEELVKQIEKSFRGALLPQPEHDSPEQTSPTVG